MATVLKETDLENNVGDYYMRHLLAIRSRSLSFPLSSVDGSTCMLGKCSTTEPNPCFLLHITRQALKVVHVLMDVKGSFGSLWAKRSPQAELRVRQQPLADGIPCSS